MPLFIEFVGINRVVCENQFQMNPNVKNTFLNLAPNVIYSEAGKNSDYTKIFENGTGIEKLVIAKCY